MADPASVLSPLSVPQEVKANAWDVYQNATDQNDFQKRLGALNIPQEAKANLWDLKYGSGAAPAADDVDAKLQKLMQQQPGGGDEGLSFGGVGSEFLKQGADIAGTIAGAPAAMWNTLRHPIDTLSQMATPPQQQIPESQMPQDAIHKLQRWLGGGPNYNPPGKDMPFSDVAKYAVSSIPFAAAPELFDIGKNAAPSAYAFSKAAVKAGGPDVGVGAIKVGSGAVLDQLGAPYHIGTVLGVREGLPQIFRGVGKGFKAGRAALNPEVEAPPNPPGGEPPPPPGASPAPAAAPQGPPPGVDPDAWKQLTPEVRDAIWRGKAMRREGPAPTAGPLTVRPMPEMKPIPNPGGSFKILDWNGDEVAGFPNLAEAQKAASTTGTPGLTVRVPLDAAREMEQQFGRESLLGLDVEGVGKITGFQKGEGSSFPRQIAPQGIAAPAESTVQGARPEGVTLKSPVTVEGSRLSAEDVQRAHDYWEPATIRKNQAVADYFKAKGITADDVAKMPDTELDAHVKQVINPETKNYYRPSTGKNLSRSKDIARGHYVAILRGGSMPNPINPTPMPPK